jgi:peptidoglycan hydrolase-like protein with peptidoglycan-binding domain
VNAAAYALQVSSLRRLADAGCLTDEQEQDAVAAVASYTTAIQTSLSAAGYLEGEIDGIYGPATVAAVEQLQTDSDLPVTGLVDQVTAVALDEAVAAAGGDAAAAEVAHTAALQATLTLAGYWTGPINGVWTDALTAALQDLRTDLGIPPTGVVDAATLAAVERAVAEAEAAPDEDDEDDDGTATTEP